MKNKIVKAKKKKQAAGKLMAMGSVVGNRVAGKILTPKGEVSKIKA